MSDHDKLAKRLFEQWKSALKQKDSKGRKWDAVESNFDELFFELNKYDIPYDMAEGFIDEAAASHMPSYMAVESVWKGVKAKFPGSEKKEWLDSWKGSIRDKAVASFFNWYKPVEVKVDKPTGAMDPQEYAKQRRYADKFSAISPSELKDLEAKRQQFLESKDDLEAILADI